MFPGRPVTAMPSVFWHRIARRWPLCQVRGGAAGQRERVAELAMMAREQGREVHIIAADRRSQMNLKQDERLPESVLRESQREQEAVREVARENLLQERLQQMERDIARDLQKEKTLGGD